MSGLTIEGLCKSFGQTKAVDALDLTVEPGEIVGFLGPNGAGKSTTMRSILGVVKPDAGSIFWNGNPIDATFAQAVGYMPQERGLYPRMKTKEQVVYFGRLSGLSKKEAQEKADSWLEKVGLSDRANSQVQELSGGNQQRVQLLVSLVHDPKLLVLDEPFAGLDPLALQLMKEILKEQVAAGAAVLFSSHQLSLVSDLCDRVVIVANGTEVASGTSSELRTTSPLRRLTVRWLQDRTSDWVPEGTVLTNEARRISVEVPVDISLEETLSRLKLQGELVEFTFEPPELDEIFADLITEQSENKGVGE